MNRAALTAVALGLFLLAGCSQKDLPPSTTATGASSSSSPSTTTPTQSPTNTSLPLSSPLIVLDKCAGWQVGYPFGAGPAGPKANAPPGWAPSPTDQGSLVFYGVDCQRVSVGPFERPARLVWEVNVYVTPPTNCTIGTTGGPTIGILNDLYLEDPELAAYLGNTYGVPVQVSKITNTTQAAQGTTVHTWTWGPTGMTPSSLNILEDTSTPDTPNSLYMFWQKGAGIGALRAETEVVRPLVGNREAYGTLKPPMQAASVLGGNFAGPGDWNPSFKASGAFSLYSDTNCMTPV